MAIHDGEGLLAQPVTHSPGATAAPGVSVEVIDLRSLNPLDLETICRWQDLRQRIRAEQELGQSLFGSYWHAEDSDAELLGSLVLAAFSSVPSN